MVQEAGVQRVFSPARYWADGFSRRMQGLQCPTPNLSSPSDVYLCPTFVIMDPDERDLGMQPNSQLGIFTSCRKIIYLGWIVKADCFHSVPSRVFLQETIRPANYSQVFHILKRKGKRWGEKRERVEEEEKRTFSIPKADIWELASRVWSRDLLKSLRYTLWWLGHTMTSWQPELVRNTNRWLPSIACACV